MPAERVRFVTLLLIYAAFVSMGLPDGVLGVAWPQMRAEFSVNLNANWRMLALGTCGSATSSFASGLLLRRFGVGRVLLLTTLLTAAVIFGYSAAPTFLLVTALAFLLGLGNGAIDAGLNGFVASNLSSRHMSWLHACWGVGVSLGTLIVSGVAAEGGTWRGAYRVIAGLQLLLALSFALSLRSLPSAPSRAEGGTVAAHPAYGATLRLPAAWASIAVFFVYCGLECGAGLWVASVLHDGRGWSVEAAGLMATVYWGSLTVGRFLIGTVSQRASAIVIVRVAVAGAIAGTSLVALSSVVPASGAAPGSMMALGLVLLGLSLSPVYPMLMHDTPRAVGTGHAINLIGFQGGFGQLGFTLLPIAMGTVLRAISIEWLGSMLLTLSALLFVLLALRERSIRT